MREVADTNTIVSGFFWNGAPRRVLDAARTGRNQLFTSPVLLAELEDVLSRKKFAERCALAQVTPQDLIIGYASLATLKTSPTIEPVILDDPDDDHVLACAIAASATTIVSGDNHLLNLKNHQSIQILTANDLLIRIPE